VASGFSANRFRVLAARVCLGEPCSVRISAPWTWTRKVLASIWSSTVLGFMGSVLREVLQLQYKPWRHVGPQAQNPKGLFLNVQVRAYDAETVLRAAKNHGWGCHDEGRFRTCGGYRGLIGAYGTWCSGRYFRFQGSGFRIIGHIYKDSGLGYGIYGLSDSGIEVERFETHGRLGLWLQVAGSEFIGFGVLVRLRAYRVKGL